MVLSIVATDKGKRIYEIITAIISVLFGVMFLITPMCGDDNWYLGGTTGSTWSTEALRTTWNTVSNLWYVTNGRVGNLVSALFLAFLPRWVWAMIMSISLWGIFYIGPRLANTRWLSIGSGLWIIGVSLVFPWPDFMFSIMFSLNYLPTLILGLLSFYWFTSRYGDSSEVCNWSVTIGCFLVAMLAGWWHEGFGVPMLCACGIYGITRWKRPSRVSAAIFLGIMAGLGCITISPAFWASMDFRQPIWNKGAISWKILHLIGFNICFYIYFIMFVFAIGLKKTRNKIRTDRSYIAFLVAVLCFGIITLPIYIKYYAGPRTGAFSQLISLIGIIAILPIFFMRNINGESGNTGRFLFYLMSVLCMVNIAISIPIQVKLTKEIESVRALWKAEKRDRGGVVFYDKTPIRVGFDLMKPSYQVLNTNYGLEGMRVLPCRLAKFNYNMGTRCSDSTLVIFDNLIIYRGDWNLNHDNEERPDLIVVLKDGEKEYTRADWQSFRGMDGNIYTYVEPHNLKMNRNLKIVDAEIIR